MTQNISYFREALREPINIGALVLTGVVTIASGASGFLAPSLILGGAAVAEGLYLTIVPAATAYRRLVNRRYSRVLDEDRRLRRLELIKTFDTREREAVEYLSWMKNQIATNYRRSLRGSDDPPQLRELETAWEAFVDLLDEYRRRKQHLRHTNRQSVENQIRQAERTTLVADPATRSLHEKNTEILRRRLQTFDDIERSIRRVEAQLQMIENFFGLVNDQVATMPSPDLNLSGDFDTLLTSIEATREILQQTAPVMSQLDQLNREASQFRPTLAG